MRGVEGRSEGKLEMVGALKGGGPPVCKAGIL